MAVDLDGLILHLPDFLGKLADKMAVMDYGQDCPIKTLQSLFKSGTRGNVQMVDRFIQDQEIAALRHKTAKR